MAVTAAPATFNVPEFRPGKKSSAIRSTTGLLPTTKFEASHMPLRLISPRGDMGADSRYKWANSRFAYNVVIAVQGGAPPYRCEVLSKPSDASVTMEAPSWNPHLYLWARVNWPSPTGTGVFVVRITDQDGAAVLASWSAVTDNSKWRWLDAVSGSNSNNGIPVADGGTGPWQTCAAWTGTDTSDATYADLHCVYRAGTYDSIPYGGISLAMVINDNKPKTHIRYPGEAAVFDLTDGTIRCASGPSDVYLAFDTINGPTGSNPKLLHFPAPVSRVVIDRPSFDTPTNATVGNDNNSCIEFADNATPHAYIAVIDPSWDTLPSNANGFSCLDWYNVSYAVVAGGSGRSVNCYMGIWMKGANRYVSVFSVDLWDEAHTPAKAKIHCQLAGGSLAEVKYCRVFQPDGSANQEQSMLFGDSNQEWGPLVYARNNIAGRIGQDGRGNSIPKISAANVNTSTNLLTYDWSGMATGDACTIAATTTLPSPLVAATTYYIIKISSTVIKLAASNADALAGTAINLTSAGSGTITVTLTTGSVAIKLYSVTASSDELRIWVPNRSGQPCVLTSTGTLPSPLLANTRYYVIYVSDTTCKLAATYDDAIAGNAIDITSAGTGVMSMTTYMGYLQLLRNLQWCDAGTPVNYTTDIDVLTGNVTRARSAIATDLSSGLLTGDAYDDYYGTVGAEVAAA